jgi:hypothetical protein
MANVLQSTSPTSNPQGGDTPGNDPQSYSMTTVKNWVTDNQGDALTALTAETGGANPRASLITWLHGQFVTGAAAGIPGVWSPTGKILPASVAALTAGTPNTVVASPLTAWTAGQYVQTATAGVGGRAHWNSTAWVSGAA